jgi:FixJ family two-component response regulator
MGSGRMVLVVEDDLGMREALESLLHAAGFESAAYATAEDLLSADRIEQAVCVISDIRLPAMSGLDLLDEIRVRGGWPPVIVITAHDTPGVRDEAERHGAAAYLAKPFLGRALLDAIEGLSKRARHP